VLTAAPARAGRTEWAMGMTGEPRPQQTSSGEAAHGEGSALAELRGQAARSQTPILRVWLREYVIAPSRLARQPTTACPWRCHHVHRAQSALGTGKQGLGAWIRDGLADGRDLVGGP
jgi:hypothetical protein